MMTRAALMAAVEEDVFRSGEYHTGYLEELLDRKD